MKHSLLIGVSLACVASAAQAQTIDRRVLGCIAHVVYGEARDEPVSGQIAVGQSIIFRAAAGLREHGGRDICDVAYKNTPRRWEYDGAKVRIRERLAWDKSLEVAEFVLTSRHTPDMPYMYFCSTQVRKACRWHDRATKFVRQIGNHRFYTDPRFPTLATFASYQQ